MYLVIFEDGSVQKSKELHLELLEAAEDRIIDLIDLANPESPRRYHSDGKWEYVEDTGTGL